MTARVLIVNLGPGDVAVSSKFFLVGCDEGTDVIEPGELLDINVHRTKELRLYEMPPEADA